MKSLSIVLCLSAFLCIPLTAEAYYQSSYGYGHHSGSSYGHYSGKHYGYHYYGYSPYQGKAHYGYSRHYKRPYDDDYKRLSHSKYHYPYTDGEGYTYFISPKYGKIYCDHPYHREFHKSSIRESVKYYCGDKYGY